MGTIGRLLPGHPLVRRSGNSRPFVSQSLAKPCRCATILGPHLLKSALFPERLAAGASSSVHDQRPSTPSSLRSAGFGRASELTQAGRACQRHHAIDQGIERDRSDWCDGCARATMIVGDRVPARAQLRKWLGPQFPATDPATDTENSGSCRWAKCNCEYGCVACCDKHVRAPGRLEVRFMITSIARRRHKRHCFGHVAGCWREPWRTVRSPHQILGPLCATAKRLEVVPR